jgi:hypothetical protein
VQWLAPSQSRTPGVMQQLSHANRTCPGTPAAVQRDALDAAGHAGGRLHSDANGMGGCGLDRLIHRYGHGAKLPDLRDSKAALCSLQITGRNSQCV